MEIVYLLALGGVCLAILGVLVDSIIAVSSAARWESVHYTPTVVQTTERRSGDFSFVGAERRRDSARGAEEPKKVEAA